MFTLQKWKFTYVQVAYKFLITLFQNYFYFYEHLSIEKTKLKLFLQFCLFSIFLYTIIYRKEMYEYEQVLLECTCIFGKIWIKIKRSKHNIKHYQILERLNQRKLRKYEKGQEGKRQEGKKRIVKKMIESAHFITEEIGHTFYSNFTIY